MRFELTSTRTPRTESRDEARESTPATSVSRLGRPGVQFGLRVAVLAGVIATTGGTTTGLGSAINSLAGPADTTCCGGETSISRIV